MNHSMVSAVTELNSGVYVNSVVDAKLDLFQNNPEETCLRLIRTSSTPKGSWAFPLRCVKAAGCPITPGSGGLKTRMKGGWSSTLQLASSPETMKVAES